MKKLKRVNEDDVIYTEFDLIELSEDIEYLIDNPPIDKKGKKARKDGKQYKDWLKEIRDRMKRYNEITGRDVYVKTFTP